MNKLTFIVPKTDQFNISNIYKCINRLILISDSFGINFKNFFGQKLGFFEVRGNIFPIFVQFKMKNPSSGPLFYS